MYGLYNNDNLGLPTFAYDIKVNYHAPAVTFDFGDQDAFGVDYYSYTASIQNKKGEKRKGTAFASKIKLSKDIQKATLREKVIKLNNHLSFNIDSKSSERKNSAIQRLPEVPSDKDIDNHTSLDLSSLDTLQEILYKYAVNQDEFNRMMLKAYDTITTQMKASNDLLRAQTEALVEQNRHIEEKKEIKKVGATILNETLTSIAQNLEYLPQILEVMNNHSDRYVDLQNIANAHHLTKNINDVAIFEDNKKNNKVYDSIHSTANATKDLADVLQRNMHGSNVANNHISDKMDIVADNLKHMETTASETKKVAQYLDIITVNTELQRKQLEKEESIESHSILDTITDFTLNVYDDIANEFDIFSNLLKTSIGANPNE